MPDTYQYTATNPQTGKRVGWDGKAWVPITEPAGIAFGKDVGRGMGLDTGKIERMETDQEGHRHAGMGALEVVRQAMKGAGDWADQTIRDPFHAIDPIEGMASQVTKALGLPDKVNSWRDYFKKESYQKPNLGELLGSGSMVLGGAESPRVGEVPGRAVEAAKTTGRAAKAVGEAAKDLPKEVAGSGATMDRLVAAKDQNFLQAKNTVLEPLRKAVHDNAKGIIEQAVSQMDSKLPGVAEKSSLASDVKGIFDKYVKLEDEKRPATIEKILDTQGSTGGSTGVRALSNKELEVARIAGQLKKEGLSEKEIRSSISNLGFVPKQIDGIMSLFKPDASPVWGAREFQQLRSDLGGEIFRRNSTFVGPVRTAAIEAYRHLGDVLDKAAEKANAQMTWRVGNEKWRLYNETFDGKWQDGSFHESPLGRAFGADTADEFFNALGRDRVQWTRDLLGRYKQFSGKIPELLKAMERHNRLNWVQEASKIHKWEAGAAVLYPVAPGIFESMAALRLLVPPALRWLMTRGVNPENVRGFKEVAP